MKHNLKITLILVILFFSAQVIGLIVTKQYFPEPGVEEELPLNIERPQFEAQTSYVPIFLIILIATLLAFLLAKFNAFKIWKAWFFISVLIILTISFKAFFNQYIAFGLAAILAIFKVFKQNVYIHNFSELFIYGGLAALFVPVLNVISAIILLILISIYDAYAVWKSKHMIKLAKFQAKANVFAGLYLPYKKSSAVLGGGDIGFPLLFAAVLLPTFGFLKTLIIPIFATLALLLLLIKGKKNHFYPAMPFITAGCLLGYFILISLHKVALF